VAIAQEQEVYAVGTSAAPSLTVTEPTEGNLIIAMLTCGYDTVAIDQSGWTAYPLNDATNLCLIYYKVAGASEGTTVSWTLGSLKYYGAAFLEYSGMDATPADQNASNSSAGTYPDLTVTAASQNAIANSLIVIAGLVYQDNITVSGSTGYVEEYTAAEANWMNTWFGTRITSALETPSFTLTHDEGANAEMQVSMAVFSEASARPTSGVVNGGGGITATAAKFEDQLARPASTVTASSWDTGPTTGQNLHTYTSDDSDATWIEDTTA